MPPIALNCSCGARIMVRRTATGRQVKCPRCVQMVAVPSPVPGRQTAQCTTLCSCGRRLFGPAEAEGEFTVCPDCLRWNRLQSSRDRVQAWNLR